MVQFYSTSRNPAYAQGAANLSQALFGGNQSTEGALREELLARKVGIEDNKLRGQNDFRDILSGTNGDLSSVDGGSLAAAIGLANINPRAFTAMSLDPRFDEMEQRRATVASGSSPSMGTLSAEIGLTNARTNLANQRAATAGESGGRDFKPPQLVPKNVAAIREAAMEELGLDENRLKRTIQQNESLGTAILDVINSANVQGLGNAAYTQGRVQELLSSVVGEEQGGGIINGLARFLPGEQDNRSYAIDEEALSSILSSGQELPQQLITGQDPLSGVEAPEVQSERIINGTRYLKINGQWFEE